MVRKALMILAAVTAGFATAAAQDLKISGTVTDQTGYPLEGATVMVKVLQPVPQRTLRAYTSSGPDQISS